MGKFLFKIFIVSLGLRGGYMLSNAASQFIKILINFNLFKFIGCLIDISTGLFLIFVSVRFINVMYFEKTNNL